MVMVYSYDNLSSYRHLGDMVHRNDSSNSNHERQASIQSASSFLSWFGYHGNSDSTNGMPRRSSSNGIENIVTEGQISITPSDREDIQVRNTGL